MIRRRQLLTAASGATPLLAGCLDGVTGTSPANENPNAEGDVASDEIETLSEDPDCSNPDEQSRLIVTPRGATVVADTQAAADSFIDDLSADADVEAEVVETEDQYAVEVHSAAVSLDELRRYVDDQPDLGPVRVGLTTPTLRGIAHSVRESLNESEDVSDYSVYRVRTAEAELDRLVAVVNIRDAEGLSPSQEVTLYAEADGERRTLVDKSLFTVTGVEEQNSMISVQIQFTETGRKQYRRRLSEVVDLNERVGRVLYIDVGDETVWNGSLSPNLAHVIRTGEWEGKLVVTFSSQEEASAFTSAVNLLQLSVPAETRLEPC